MHPALDSIGSLLSQGRICRRAMLGASSPSPHSPARRRLKASSGVARKSKVGHEHYEHDPVKRLIRYPNSANQVTAYTDAVGNMLSVVKASGYTPSLTFVRPNVIRRGDVKANAPSGERLKVGALQSSDAALDLGNVRQTASRILVEMTVCAASTRRQTLTFASLLLKACFCLGAAGQRTYSGIACTANY